MLLSELLTPRQIIPDLKVTSKKQALTELASFAAGDLGIEDRTIADVLIERERLGSTGVGRGVAIPHGKLPQIDRLYLAFARLSKPVAFDSLFIAKALQQGFAQANGNIFHGMMHINLHVAVAFHVQTESAMYLEQIQHVIQKSGTGLNFSAFRLVEIQRKRDLRFARITNNFRLPHFYLLVIFPFGAMQNRLA